MAPAARKGDTASTAADINQQDAAQQQAEHPEEENQSEPQEFAMMKTTEEDPHQQEIHDKDDEASPAEEEEPNSADVVAVVNHPQEDAAVESVAERIEEDDPEEVEDEEEEQVPDDGNVQETVNETDHSMQTCDVGLHGDDEGGNKQTSASGKDSEGNGSSSRGKIFIGGLTRDTTTEMLTAHFKKYGEIVDSVIMKNRTTGHPRGFGFVTFADPAVVDVVLKDTHVLDGKTVEAKRTVPREVMSTPTKGPKTKKIFVGGLKTSTKEDEFRGFFEKFGKIVECQIMQDHSTGRSRGFGFVTFESEQSVEEVLAQGKMHELDGKQVEIKKAEPKRDEAPANHDRSGHYRARGNTGYDANTNFYPGFGGTAPPYYSGASAPYNRVAGRQAGYSYGTSYGYGAGYGGFYGGGFSDVDDGYGGMAYNYTGYGSGSGYGNVYGSGGYGSSGRGYSSGRYHPYSR